MEKFPIPAPVFSGDSRRVDAGAGFEWLRQGWAMFVAQPAQWILVSLLMAIILLAVSAVPFIGAFARNLLVPIFIAGMLQACRKTQRGEAPEVRDIFSGFEPPSGNLVLIGLFFLIGMFSIFSITFVMGGSGVVGGLTAGGLFGAGMAVSSVLLATILYPVLFVPLVMAVWFAPALVFFNRMSPVEAVKASFSACARNALPFLVYGLIVLILAFFAALPMFLGFLVLLPVLAGSMYASYRDVFLAD